MLAAMLACQAGFNWLPSRRYPLHLAIATYGDDSVSECDQMSDAEILAELMGD